VSERKFEYSDAKSFKFWNIRIDGDNVITTHGRIGSAGRSTVKACDSAADAQKLHDKMVKEKLKKGYQETGGASAASAAGDGLDPKLFYTTRDADFENLSTFLGNRVVNFESEKSIKKGERYVYRIGVTWDDEDVDFDKRLDAFLATDAAAKAPGLVIGNWCTEPDSVEETVAQLAENKDRLPNLAALFLGDITQEENEVSWIEQTDLSPLLAAFPKLEMLRVRGANGLGFKSANHKKLRALAIESGGLSRKTIAQLCKAKFPELEYLELWLGTPAYGGDCEVNDLQPIFAGKLFPKLKYLGLRNSEITNDIAGVIISSPVIDKLETLDLSLGTLTDEGGNALLSLPPTLKRLDLHRHYLSKDVLKKLNKLPFPVDTADSEEPEDWGDGPMRFCALSE